jgi:hypothetical protein
LGKIQDFTPAARRDKGEVENRELRVERGASLESKALSPEA